VLDRQLGAELADDRQVVIVVLIDCRAVGAGEIKQPAVLDAVEEIPDRPRRARQGQAELGGPAPGLATHGASTVARGKLPVNSGTSRAKISRTRSSRRSRAASASPSSSGANDAASRLRGEARRMLGMRVGASASSP